MISTGHSAYKQADCLAALMELDTILIYDTIGIYTEEQITTLSTHHQIKVLGRGDLAS